ncbi:hypothetical protein H920_09258, partial [Fukomys damarensis]
DKNKKLRPLYDIPYMFEAREFLRKKLIGKKVNVTVDYIRPASPATETVPAFSERTCATVTIGGIFSLDMSSSLYESIWISLSLWTPFAQKLYDSVSYYFVFIPQPTEPLGNLDALKSGYPSITCGTFQSARNQILIVATYNRTTCHKCKVAYTFGEAKGSNASILIEGLATVWLCEMSLLAVCKTEKGAKKSIHSVKTEGLKDIRNIAEALVSKGLATVIRYRQDDDQRSSHYDELLAAEARAIKNGKGLHSKKEVPIHRVADISGDTQKAKQFLPFLQRAGRSEAVVEYVFSGSRLKLYLPKETCLITFLLAGIECPRGARNLPGLVQEGEPFSEEATLFTKELVLQREQSEIAICLSLICIKLKGLEVIEMPTGTLKKDLGANQDRKG